MNEYIYEELDAGKRRLSSASDRAKQGCWECDADDREQHVEFLAEGQQSYQDAFLDDESELDGLGFLEQRCHQVRRYYR